MSKEALLRLVFLVNRLTSSVMSAMREIQGKTWRIACQSKYHIPDYVLMVYQCNVMIYKTWLNMACTPVSKHIVYTVIVQSFVLVLPMCLVWFLVVHLCRWRSCRAEKQTMTFFYIKQYNVTKWCKNALFVRQKTIVCFVFPFQMLVLERDFIGT